MEISVKLVAQKFHAQEGELDNVVEGAFLAVIPEPDNTYDANAVQVMAHINGEYRKVGYLPAGFAARYEFPENGLFGVAENFRYHDNETQGFDVRFDNSSLTKRATQPA